MILPNSGVAKKNWWLLQMGGVCNWLSSESHMVIILYEAHLPVLSSLEWLYVEWSDTSEQEVLLCL